MIVTNNRFVGLMFVAIVVLLFVSTATASGPPVWKQIEIKRDSEQNDVQEDVVEAHRFFGVSLNMLNVAITTRQDNGYEGTLFTPGFRVEFSKRYCKYFSFGILAETFVFIDSIPWILSNGIFARLGAVPKLVIPIKDRVYLYSGCIVGGIVGVITENSDVGSDLFVKPILGASFIKSKWGASIDLSPGIDWLWRIQDDIMVIATAAQLNIGAVYRF